MQCAKILESGDQCKAYSLRDSEYCLFHDERPEIVAIREKAKKSAALSGKIAFPEIIDGQIPALTKLINVRKPRDIKKGIIRTLQELRFGIIGINLARALFYGFSVLSNYMRSIEQPQDEFDNASENIRITYDKAFDFGPLRSQMKDKENNTLEEGKDKKTIE